jgi:hypothetical protein
MYNPWKETRKPFSPRHLCTDITSILSSQDSLTANASKDVLYTTSKNLYDRIKIVLTQQPTTPNPPYHRPLSRPLAHHLHPSHMTKCLVQAFQRPHALDGANRQRHRHADKTGKLFYDISALQDTIDIRRSSTDEYRISGLEIHRQPCLSSCRLFLLNLFLLNLHPLDLSPIFILIQIVLSGKPNIH